MQCSFCRFTATIVLVANDFGHVVLFVLPNDWTAEIDTPTARCHPSWKVSAVAVLIVYSFFPTKIWEVLFYKLFLFLYLFIYFLNLYSPCFSFSTSLHSILYNNKWRTYRSGDTIRWLCVQFGRIDNQFQSVHSLMIMKHFVDILASVQHDRQWHHHIQMDTNEQKTVNGQSGVNGREGVCSLFFFVLFFFNVLNRDSKNGEMFGIVQWSRDLQ